MKRLLFPIALLAAMPAWADQPAPPASAEVAKPPKGLAKELASGDGQTKATAIVIFVRDEFSGVAKEYALLDYLGLVPGSQELVVDDQTGKVYDHFEARDRRTGEPREVWFDIGRYFGKM